jgi:hypothetical protein
MVLLLTCSGCRPLVHHCGYEGWDAFISPMWVLDGDGPVAHHCGYEGGDGLHLTYVGIRWGWTC